MIEELSPLIPGITQYRLPSDSPVAVEPEFAEHAAQCAAALVSRVRSHGLLVTSGTVPSLSRSAQRVAECLELGRMPEVYVVSDPDVNARAIWAADTDRSFIEVHSGLLRICRGTELDFVLGHELAHIAFGHSARQAPSSEGPNANRMAVMRHRRAERAAEISCDRIGFLVTRSVATSSRVIMKLASGLDDALLGADSATLLQQLEAEQGEQWSLQATHPALPLRLWALWEFSRVSEFGGTVPLADINDRIEQRLDQETGDELRDAEHHARSKCLFWLGITLIHSTSDAASLGAMRERFGWDEVDRGLRFAADFPQDSLRAKVMDHLSVVLAGPAMHASWVLSELGVFRPSSKSIPHDYRIFQESVNALKATIAANSAQVGR